MRTPHIVVCSIIASGALLLPTAASGAPPATAAPPAPPRLQEVAFTSPQRGYGLFDQVAKVCRAEVAATANGGARFARAHIAARWSCDANAPVSAIAADSTGDVFVFGPALAVSHDHGRSWTRSRIGDVLALSAVGRSAWLLTTRCTGHGATADRCPVRLLVSANGGRSWRLARLPGATVAGFGSQAVGQAELVRTSKATGYVLTGPDVNPRGKPDAARIWITRNGGSTWSRHAVPCGLAHGTMSCPPLSFGYLGEIAATSNGAVFLVGPRSPLLVTHNAGRTWRTVKPVIGDGGGGTSSVAFFGRRGIVVGNDPANNELPAIWRTTDGGTHWHVVHPVIS